MQLQEEDSGGLRLPKTRSMLFTTEVVPAPPVSTHPHFAGRQPAGTSRPITLLKEGVKHIREEDGVKNEIMCIGLACSECFSGARLAKVMQRGLEYEQNVYKALLLNEYAPPMAIHTSAGVTEPLAEFIDALEPHLPWKNASELDWCLSLQLEGASAVWAAVDMLLQEQIISTGNNHRKMVAVASTSYHGPPSTSFGSKSPLWAKSYQIMYPSPVAGEEVVVADFVDKFTAFLDKHADEIGVMLVEPQWGSMQCALPWPKELLQQYVKMAQERGIKVLSDEIMCGLGRHGLGTMFVAEAWDLDVDAITFGKAVAAGLYPLSGAVMKRGCQTLCNAGRSVMQSHTYAGSHTRALITATEVIKELPIWFESISKLGEELRFIFRVVEKVSQGMLVCHGQGLMWGGLFTHKGKNTDENFRAKAVQCFKNNCHKVGVLPYHTPVGGFMVSPVVDIDVGTVYEFGEKLEQAVRSTVEECGWESISSPKEEDASSIQNEIDGTASLRKCIPTLHNTRSCTSCTTFVSRDKRMKFLTYK